MFADKPSVSGPIWCMPEFLKAKDTGTNIPAKFSFAGMSEYWKIVLNEYLNIFEKM